MLWGGEEERGYRDRYYGEAFSKVFHLGLTRRTNIGLEPFYCGWLSGCPAEDARLGVDDLWYWYYGNLFIYVSILTSDPFSKY